MWGCDEICCGVAKFCCRVAKFCCRVAKFCCRVAMSQYEMMAIWPLAKNLIWI